VKSWPVAGPGPVCLQEHFGRRKPAPTRDHTERIAQGLWVIGQGRGLANGDYRTGAIKLRPRCRSDVPSGYFFCGLLYWSRPGIDRGSDLLLQHVVSTHPHWPHVIIILRAMGGELEAWENGVGRGEPVGRLLSRALRGA